MAPPDNRQVMTTDGKTSAMDPLPMIATLFALLPIPVAVADESGSIVLSNSSFSEVFPGITSISGVPQREIVVPEHGTYEVHTLPLNDQGYRFVFATEVSLQLRLGKQVEQLEKLAEIGRVVTGIAHELNNPLADILECIPMVAQCNLDSSARSIVDDVFTNAARAGHLVQNLLILAGTTETRHVSFDLNEIVRNVAVQRGASQPDSPFDIQLELESNLPRAVGYPSQIEQVITSLLVHAEDAIASAHQTQGTIHVHTGVRAGRVQLQVADNGQSRSSARIFAPGSTGVGLGVCAEIAKDHGGDLYAWCAYGNGSTFTLELPACNPDAASSDAAGTGRWIRNKSVMVVDDEVHITELISDVLTRHGANVQVSNSGVDAYDLLCGREFDLIICDQLLSGLSGESLFHLMTSADSTRNQHFLFLTGDVITVQARQFFVETGTHHLRKPFRIQDLVEAVDGFFNPNPAQGF